MQKRTLLLAAFIVGGNLIGAPGESRAQQRHTAVDGCAVLANAVYGEVIASALFAGYRLPPEPGQGDALNCDATAASVSAGFTRAMAAMNVYLTWATPIRQPEAVCSSGDLMLCHPSAQPVMSYGALDANSVAEMWQVVAAAVSKSMPLGTMSDRSSFREYELRLRLSDALVNGYWSSPGPRVTY